MKPAALLLALASLAAQADTLTVGVNVATLHYEPGYETFTPGVYVEYASFTGGVYRNSEGGTSVHAGYMFRSVLGSPIDVIVGVVTGYDKGGVLPMLLPSLRIPVGAGAVRFTLLLPYDKGSAGIHFSLEY